MSVEKKSLINTVRTSKKAKVASGDLKPSNVTSKKMLKRSVASARAITKRKMANKDTPIYMKYLGQN